MTSYQDFLKSKQARHQPSGFECGDLPGSLFVWQADIVRWAVRLGRAAIWAGCGLGKTFMQLAWADQVRIRTGRPILLLTPLAVGPQTVREAAAFGISDVVLCANQDEADAAGQHAICVTNYQKLIKKHFRPDSFAGVVLDESSILKAYTGKTKQFLCNTFSDTLFRLACTATPAPNDYMEIGNHAEFLGVMPSNEMLARWFIANQGEGAGKYYLKGHAESDFWEWVASWAVCLDRPSDLGYSDDGFTMPPLHEYQHIARVDATKDAPPGHLWRTQKLSATNLHNELRITAPDRADVVASLVNKSSEQWVIWCNTDYEADELKARVRDAVEVRGSQTDRVKEARLEAFLAGRERNIITKPSLTGYGLNWQHCRNAAFVGLSHSYEQYLQAMSRLYRFGQKRPVNNHIVIAETEGDVLANIQRKHRENLDMRQALVLACNRTLVGRERRLVRVEPESRQGESWTLHLGDSCEVIRSLESDAIGLSIFSPPFSNLYIYSDAESDMGNSADDAEFLKHFSYLAPEILRITIPGRCCAIHCKDLPKYANRDDTAGLKDFPGDLVRVMEGAGWSYHSRVTIWKCPVVERERTNNNGLLHKTVRRDSSQLRQGMADFLLVFRKVPAGDNLMSSSPIERPEGFTDYIGRCDPRGEAGVASRHPSPFSRLAGSESRWEELPDGKIVDLTPSVNIWQRYADPVNWDSSHLSPSQFRAAQVLLAAGMSRAEVADALGLWDTDAVWFDIDQMDVLNHKDAKGVADERHICPLQLGLIRRAVCLWSAPGDLVFSPFAGVGSEGVVAVAEQRRFVGIELKRNYWERAIRHITNAEIEARQRGLFDAATSRMAGEPLASS